MSKVPAQNVPTENPSDNTTLVEVIDGYHSSGFTADFSADVGTTVTCGACQSQLAATRFVMHSMRRLEGASDPADMLAVVALSCPVCHAQGTLVLGYGPMAEPEHADVMRKLQDHRGDDTLPAASSHAESPGRDAVQGAAEPSPAMRDADVANGEGPPTS